MGSGFLHYISLAPTQEHHLSSFQMILLRHIIIKSLDLEPWNTSTSGLFLHREQASDYDMAFSDTSQSGYIFPRSATLPGLTLGIDDYLAIVPGEYANYSPAGSNCLAASNPALGLVYHFTATSSSKPVRRTGSSTPRLGFAT